MDFLFNLGIPFMFWSFIVYCILQVIALKKFMGRWRIAAGLPLLVGLLAIISTIVGAFQGSAQAPILLLLSGPPLLLYIVLVSAGYWANKRYAS